MGKSKEEDRIEKLIRGLLKLPENRRCINCNSLGPQYVCTTFWTFVCTNCSGVHREFTHRVKSVSMAKFTLEEVNALQAGGNEQARQIYFKTWDPQRNFFPDNSNIQKLRDFIKNVYVDRRYTGEHHPALVSRLRKNEKDEASERKSADTGERSPFHDRYVDRYSRFSYDEVRSPGYARENSRYGGSRSSSSRFESADCRYQVDNARIAGRAATQMFTTEDIKLRRRSPDRYQNRDFNSPPPVRHVREIFGENFLALRVGDSPKSSDRKSVSGAASGQQISNLSKPGNKSTDGQESPAQRSGDPSKTNHRRSASAYSQMQSIARTASQTSINEAAVKPKSESTGSLVDLAACNSPNAPIQKPVQKMQVVKEGENSGSPKPPVNESASSSVPPRNTLEFLLFELSGPPDITPKVGVPNNDNAASTAPASNSSPLRHMSAPSTSVSSWITSSATMSSKDPNIGLSESSALVMVPTLPSNSCDSSHAQPTPVIADKGNTARSNDVGAPEVAKPQMVPDLFGDENVSTMKVADNMCSPTVQKPEHSSAPNPISDTSSSAPQTCHVNGVTNNQPGTLSFEPRGEVSNFTAQSPSPPLGPSQETSTAVRAHASPAEAKSSGRKELPADLFASLYPSGTSGPGWQTAPSYSMGYSMQYHPASMQIPAFPNVGKSTNPFDIGDTTVHHQATTFPSMASLQGGLPNVSASPGILRSASLGPHVPGFPPTQAQSYTPSAYMAGQDFYNNMPTSRQQGVVGGFGSEGGIPGSLNLNQQNPYAYSSSSNSGSFRMGGNPFG